MRIFPLAKAITSDDHLIKVVQQKYGPETTIITLDKISDAPDSATYVLVIMAPFAKALHLVCTSMRVGRGWSYQLYELMHTAMVPDKAPD